MRLAASALSLLVLGCAPAPDDRIVPGVIEAELVHVAASEPGRLVELAVARGATVDAGQTLFRVEAPEDGAELAEARARVGQQAAQLADLQTGRRPAEIAVVNAQLAQARSALKETESRLRRERELAAQGFVSNVRLDALQSERDAAAAHVRELQAQLRVAELAGRDDARAAAAAALQAAEAQAKQVAQRLAAKTVQAPVAGSVDDTLFRVGEWVPAGTPVVNLLPPASQKVRFFVAESVLPSLQVGAPVTIRCDGCPAPIEARIRYISNSAEFTPPVIYSREQRARLVFLVEAWPSAADAARLRPGQPVDVALGAQP